MTREKNPSGCARCGGNFVPGVAHACPPHFEQKKHRNDRPHPAGFQRVRVDGGTRRPRRSIAATWIHPPGTARERAPRTRESLPRGRRVRKRSEAAIAGALQPAPGVGLDPRGPAGSPCPQAQSSEAGCDAPAEKLPPPLFTSANRGPGVVPDLERIIETLYSVDAFKEYEDLERNLEVGTSAATTGRCASASTRPSAAPAAPTSCSSARSWSSSGGRRTPAS